MCPFIPANVLSEGVARARIESSILFSFELTLPEGEGPASRSKRFAGERSAAGLHASRDSLYRTASDERQCRAGVIPLELLPRRCPLCGDNTIIGHGRRLRQAHDDLHERIWVRRGICHPCSKTFTVLPDWLAPSGHFSVLCRRQACERIAAGNSVEQAPPHCKDPSRSPDPSTLRRWAHRRLLSIWCWMKAGVQRRAVFTGTHHPCLGSRRILPYSADRGKKSVNRQALDELKQQISLMDYLQAHDWHPARPLSRGRWMGLCPLHEDHKPSFLVDPNKDTLLLLRLWPRRGCDSLRGALSPGEVPASLGGAAPMARRGRLCCPKPHVSIAFSYTATARRLPICTNADSARRK